MLIVNSVSPGSQLLPRYTVPHDEAFMSRILLSLGYEKLDDNAREQIWNKLFKKLKEDHRRGGLEIRLDYVVKQYVRSKEIQALQWNGREIRNGESSAASSWASLLTCESFPNRCGFSSLRLEVQRKWKPARGD
jgi:hypothetical protein